MGFSVTAASIIFFIAALTAGSAATGAYWKSTADLTEAQREAAIRADEVVHTLIEIPSDPSYNSGADRLTFFVDNMGSVPLLVSEFVYVVDGIVEMSFQSGYPRVEGDPNTDLLLPNERMEVRLTLIDPDPNFLKVTAGNGVSAYWQE